MHPADVPVAADYFAITTPSPATSITSNTCLPYVRSEMSIRQREHGLHAIGMLHQITNTISSWYRDGTCTAKHQCSTRKCCASLYCTFFLIGGQTSSILLQCDTL